MHSTTTNSRRRKRFFITLLVGVLFCCLPLSGALGTTIGNVTVDTTSTAPLNQIVAGADDSYFWALVTDSIQFERTSGATVEVGDGKVYGTPTDPIPRVTVATNLSKKGFTNLNLVWNDQELRTLSEYCFFNRIPGSIKLPVPFFFTATNAFQTNPSVFDYYLSPLPNYSTAYPNPFITLNKLYTRH